MVEPRAGSGPEWDRLLGVSQGIVHTAQLVAGGFCALCLVYAGYLYLTSQGEPVRLARAKEAVWGAVVGLVLVLSAGVIAGSLGNVFHFG